MSAAPLAFVNAINSAAYLLDVIITDNITVNIAIGYGSLILNGQTYTQTNGSAASGPAGGGVYGYSAVPSYLQSTLSPAVRSGANALPNGSIQGKSQVIIWSAEEKALGLISATDPSIDGASGFAIDIPTNLLQGVALHELTHAMGRVPGVSGIPDLFDLDHFSAQGVRAFGTSTPSTYFSLDNGVTSLGRYDTGGSAADFINTGSAYDPTTNDLLDEYYGASTLQELTHLDILQIEALGFHTRFDLQHLQTSFTSDKAPGIILRSNTTGDYGFESVTAAGTHVSGLVSLGGSSASFATARLGDFNGDGTTDILFRNDSTGDYGFETLVNGTPSAWHYLGGSSTAYTIVGAGDFNGDGVSDVMFRNNATGDYGYEAVLRSGAQDWRTMGTSSAAYTVVATADFNDDGITDVMFRDNSSGSYGYEAMGANGPAAWVYLGGSASTYHVIGAGDFNGDGLTDVMFYETGTGNFGYEALVPNGPWSWHGLGSLGTILTPVGVQDLNGDGTSDLVLRNSSTGELSYMEMSQNNIHTIHSMGTPSADYFIVT